MSLRRRDRKGLARLLRYTSGGMDGKERNAYEKDLQKDPFEADAAEGFSMITAEEADKDIAFLRRRLMNKGSDRITIPLLRAASLAGVVLISVLMYETLKGDRKEMLLSDNNIPARELKPLPVAVTEGIKKAAPVHDIKEASEEKDDFDSEIDITTTVAEKAEEKEITEIAVAAETKRVASSEEQRLSNFRLMEEMKAKGMDKARASKQPAILEGTVISVDDGLPLPGASVVIKGTSKGAMTDINGHFTIDATTDSSLMLVASYIGMETMEMKVTPDTEMLIALNSNKVALDEVVVVGYGTSKRSDSEESYDYTPPLPSTGNEAFKDYLKQNQRYPDGTEATTRVVVVIVMKVGVDGTLSDITAVRSPSKPFTDEAIRLIKEGPGWNPARVNGVAREDKVRVRIVFNP